MYDAEVRADQTGLQFSDPRRQWNAGRYTIGLTWEGVAAFYIQLHEGLHGHNEEFHRSSKRKKRVAEQCAAYIQEHLDTFRTLATHISRSWPSGNFGEREELLDIASAIVLTGHLLPLVRYTVESRRAGGRPRGWGGWRDAVLFDVPSFQDDDEAHTEWLEGGTGWRLLEVPAGTKAHLRYARRRGWEEMLWWEVKSPLPRVWEVPPPFILRGFQ